VAQRLKLIVHGATTGTHDLLFGDRSSVLRPDVITPLSGRVATWSSGPEPACTQTAARLGGEPTILSRLADLGFGRWHGRTLMEVGTEDPNGVKSWLTDPSATPHGGESLRDLIQRVGEFCDSHPWPPGQNVVVVTGLVARAITVHALGAPSEVIFRIDAAPLCRVGLSRDSSSWRLQQLG
jgi:broad specificity phosphatase PhoE